MTYQRNIQLQDLVYEGFPECVQEAQIGPRDHDEAENDRGALSDMTAIRPLHAAELVDDVAQERDDPTSRRTAARPRALALLLALLGDGGIELVGSGLDDRIVLELEVFGTLGRSHVPALREDGAAGSVLDVGLARTRASRPCRAAAARLAPPTLLCALSIAG